MTGQAENAGTSRLRIHRSLASVTLLGAAALLAALFLDTGTPSHAIAGGRPPARGRFAPRQITTESSSVPPSCSATTTSACIA